MHDSLFLLPIKNPVAIFGLAMLLILVVPLLLRKWRVPDVVGLLMTGVLIGPNALGLLDRDPTIVLLGTVGLLYIMFEAGLEVDMNEFHKYRNRSIVFGTLTFILPITIGTSLALFVLDFGWASAILLGSLFASHTLLSYPIASRLGLSRLESVTTAVGGTIITDTAALLVLAVVANTVSGESGWFFWTRMISFLALYAIGTMILIPILGRWFFKTFRGGGEHFVFVIAVVFITAFLAEVAGVEAIIGAFLAGLALNRLVPPQSTLMNRIHFVGENMFIPFFLFSVGMLVDYRVLIAGADAWIVAGIMLFSVIVGKWFAAQAARPLMGYTSTHAGLLFGLSIPQAAATLAASLVGYQLGLFDEFVLNGTILMMLITCILGPFATEYFGRKAAAELEMQASGVENETPERILVPLANPDTAGDLVDVALLMRRSIFGNPLYPLTVARPGGNEEQNVILSERLLSSAIIHAASADVPVRPLTRIDLNIADGITRAIREERISFVVMGWNGQSLARSYVFGSVMDDVVRDTRSMIALCRVVRPFNTNRRVYIAIPPLARRESGFSTMLSTIKNMSSQMGCPIIILSQESEIPHIKKLFEQISPQVQVTYSTLNGWTNLVQPLSIMLKEDDLFILVSVREGTLSWRPSLNRLPRLLAQKFDNINQITIYLPESTSLTLSDLGYEIKTVHKVDLDDLEEKSTYELLSSVVHSLFPEPSSSQERLTRRLFALSEDYTPEVTPGHALYHAHSSLVQSPVLILGVSSKGVSLPGLSKPAKIILALIVPSTMPSQAYLNLLNNVSRLARNEETLISFIKQRTSTLFN